MSNDQQARVAGDPGVTRRGFLTGIGAGAAGAVIPADGLAQEALDPRASSLVPQTRSDRFSRLFARLPPFAEATAGVKQALRDLGAPGGLMDAKDPLQEGPIRLITNPELSPNNRDNTAHTAGVTFLGQFLDHDLTFDATSRLGVPTVPERSRNTRTARLDLDSVYGGGHPFRPNSTIPATARNSRSGMVACSKTCPATTRGRRSSPTRGTTRT